MRGLPNTLLIVAAAAVPTGLEAQRAFVRGAVVSAETGEGIPYALVVLRPPFSQRFADSVGWFAFLDVAAGTYQLAVRQVGYVPLDTTVTVGTGPLGLRFELRRVAVELAAITVRADAPCTDPGAPDPARDPALAIVFDQLRENAARYLLLADQYPFRYRMVRRLTQEFSSGASRFVYGDTIEIRSDDRWRYRPGRVVTYGRGSMSQVKVVHLPELPDLADPNFHRTHCFRLAGLDSLDGRPHARLEFRAAAALDEADVDGSAWLDTAGYRLRRIAIRLTRPERADQEIGAISAMVTFREELPFLLVIERVFALTTRRRPGAGGLVGRTEEQRLVGVEFRRRPGEAR